MAGPNFQSQKPASQGRPDQSTVWCHSRQIGNPVWTLALAMTLEGRIDRNYLPTRELVKHRLVLQSCKRPEHENAWMENT